MDAIGTTSANVMEWSFKWDAFVMPGWGEGFGIVYLEAIACGVPVVTSKLDESQEALRHYELGIVVNPHEPAEVERGIRAALKRAPGLVPRGLEHFSTGNYEKSVHRTLDALR